MKKLLILSFSFIICILATFTIVYASSQNSCTVRFMDNKESAVSLESNFEAIGTNILFTSQTVTKGECAVAPTTSPTVAGYDFSGWYLDKNMKEAFNFSTPINRSITLYAGYTRNNQDLEDNSYDEVELSFTETINNNLSNPINVYGVMNSEINNNSVSLPINAINKLTLHKTNVLSYINYKKKQGTIVSATYDDTLSKITITYSYNSNNSSIEITVTRAYYTITRNSYYETKATKYDSATYNDYATLLCGSSSMENWTTSTEDLSEFVTYNIGIGGTIVSDWDGIMNNRLVYPNNPKTVVYYLGINNIINNGDSGTTTGNQLCTMFDHIHETLPNTIIQFVMINYVPGYMSYKSHIDTANQIVTQYAQNKPYMNLINAGSLLLKSDGNPSWAYFKTDGLHMSQAGYLIWGNYVKQNLIDFEKEYFKDND